MRASFVFLGALILLSACTEQPPLAPEVSDDPCLRKGACEVAGADLVVDALELVFPPSQPIDPATRLRYVQEFDSITVRYRVRNRGDQGLGPSSAWMVSCDRCSGSTGVSVPLRALQPGDVDSGVVRLKSAQGFESDLIANPLLILPAVDEPFYRNNERITASAYEVVVPTYQGAIRVLSPEVRYGQHAKFVVTITNTSAYGILPDTTLAFCFRRTDLSYLSIDSCERAFAKYNFRMLRAGETRVDTIDVVVDNSMSYYEKHAAIPVRLDGCFGGTTPYVLFTCAAGTPIKLLPNVESVCAVSMLPPGIETSASFGAACFVYLGQYNVWYVDAKAGRTYRVTATSDMPGEVKVGFWNRDGALMAPEGDRQTTFTPAADGRYYVVVHRGYYTNYLTYSVRMDVS